MEKSLRLRKNLDFQRVFGKNKSYWNRQLTLLIAKNNLSLTRVGFTLSKKFGKAVERNKVKRRLRELIRNHQDLLFEGYDYIIIPKKNTKELSYDDLEKSLVHLLGLVRKKISNE